MESSPSPPTRPQTSSSSSSSEEGPHQRKFLTEEEERELASTTNRQERRRIQNRVAQRAYRQKQKQRLYDLEQKLTGFYVEHPELPEVNIESMRVSGAFDTPNNWSGLAISYPIATMLNTRMGSTPSRSPTGSVGATALRYSPERRPHSASRKQPPRSEPQSLSAVGYIQHCAEEIQENMTPYLTLSIVPVRNAVEANLKVLCIDLGQYQAGIARSPFRPGFSTRYADFQRLVSSLAIYAPNLFPTQSQLEVDHLPYIDIIPSKGIRDRLLGAMDSESFPLDQEELCHDIEWGLVVWGKKAWDERSWEWTAAFVEKWSWLFEAETLESTNFWRSQRGESPIELGYQASPSHKGKDSTYR
ncbi:hypothetical protein FN846DRAFT_909300 [Sphaerosporella brunnea]|uniref:BZIP domain-containing protein n=1 Tax=Sphaerosporella brunnea TaxID=1250544 RepID=A0A5J5ERA1_9PEZI|nr:hypothetical protein FN846DRAFT_909300 [Sphaerosporella brunnea]